ncbi:MAG: bifunctional (p)ppGpp synthetase/guanosine-3',5'-bis(diphosphate) 3'-pyrophosphohydrolase [Desulfobulbaceae bacterium]|nr:bifunctional (p)ppGpp synthetase/guanosine-3',5'-bis(diphosphate) 3'-pyrophosphohydrolase [Desulfobulbaceae bacterium]
MSDLQGLLSITKSYLQDVDLTPLRRAFDFVRERHAGAMHASGESYVQHLLEVSTTLASMKLDLDTIVSGLLHGTLKENVATTEELEKQFGKDVANIVNGTTRITNVHYNSQLAHQAENIRKLLLAMSADIRVLLVKLADRLQDMITLGATSRERQRQLARETMDLYAPLASRLGIDWMKRELEDMSFQYLYPIEYADITGRLESTLDQRQKYVEEVIGIIYAKLGENGIKPVRVIGRPKHLFSIYKKLVVQNIPLDRVYDKVAFRIILNSVKECYETLGTIHANWQPVPGRIKDFISVPKANNYQSLHTTVIGPHDNFIEIQIRTEDMDRVAQEGVAAHWAYKEGHRITNSDARIFRDLKKLVQSLQEVEDHREFLDSVRGELNEPDVYVLTPNGEVRELPRGSTPIDFAYSIHTEVGDQCSGARVNGKLVSLKYKLQHGDIVEIITQKNQHPKRAWLQIVKTSRARTRIRQWLRVEEKEKALRLGREMCERELKKHDTTLKKLVKSGHMRAMLKKLGCNALDDLLVKVGSGAITIHHLLQALSPEEFRDEGERPLEKRELEQFVQTPQQRPAAGREVIDIDGIDGMLVKVSQCCKPVPGDDIVGFITTGRGISIHKADCVNLRSTDPQRWLSVNWSSSVRTLHRSELMIRAENRKSMLADISSAISHDDAEIVSLNARTTSDNLAELDIVLEVTDLKHLQVIQQHLTQLPDIIEVRRR